MTSNIETVADGSAASGQRIKQVHDYIERELRKPNGLRKFTLGGIAKALGIANSTSCQYPVRKLIDANALVQTAPGRPGHEAVFEPTKEGLELADGEAIHTPQAAPKPKRRSPTVSLSEPTLTFRIARREPIILTVSEAKTLYSHLVKLFGRA